MTVEERIAELERQLNTLKEMKVACDKFRETDYFTDKGVPVIKTHMTCAQTIRSIELQQKIQEREAPLVIIRELMKQLKS